MMQPRADRAQIRSGQNLTRIVMETTSITASALGRKLGVPATRVKAWAVGDGCPDEDSSAVLEGLLERTKRPAFGGPRLAAPAVDSRLVCGDSREVLKGLADSSIDMILSDIPYGIGLDDWDVLHNNTNSAYMGSSVAQEKAGAVFKRRRKPINGWSSSDKAIGVEYYVWCRTWTADWLRVLKQGGSAFVFSGRRLSHRCSAAMEEEGFNLRDVLSWERTQAVFRAQRLSVVFQKRGDVAEARKWEGWSVGNLRPRFEPVIWCFKPYDVTITDNMLDHNLGAINVARFEELNGSNDNILRFGYDSGERGLHEAQKPVKLLRALIELCTVPGQVVLDPFSGSGSAAVAALASGRHFVAVERDPEMHAVAEHRIADLRQLPLIPGS